MNIFFDLDGTLLDSKERLYQLFQALVPNSKLTFDEYWKLKRNKIGHREILQSQFKYSFDAFSIFEKEWLKKIELPEWLSKDIPFYGLTEYLKELRHRHRLYIVTARQFKSGAVEQVKQFGWSDFFEDVLVTGQNLEKVDLIKNNVLVSEEDWFVGDTGKDIQCGKELSMSTAGVLTGFMNKEQLKNYNPDIIVNKVTDLTFH